MKWLVGMMLLIASTAYGYQHSGSAFVEDTAYVHNGTAFVPADKYLYVGSAFEEIESSGGSTEKLIWSVSSDTVETPSGKTAARVGSGFYTTSGCYSGGTGGCYDNNDVNQRVGVPVVAGDIINQDDFDVTFYWKANALTDYGYVFSVGVDADNRISLHTYSNGRLYSRSAFNNVDYTSWVMGTAGDVTIDTWYKIQVIWEDATNNYQVIVDDGDFELAETVTQSFVGTVDTVWFCGEEDGTSGGDSMIDEVTIK